MSHFIKKCEFGGNHGTCRCPSKDKMVIKVTCPIPNVHGPKESPKDNVIDYLPLMAKKEEPQTLHQSMEETVDSFLGAILAPEVKDALVDKLEDDVIQWLRRFPSNRNVE